MADINNLETLLDLIAEALIQSDFVKTPKDVEDNQKYIRGGQLQQGAGEGVLALFQKDIKANQEDLNQTVIINEGTPEEQVIPQLQQLADNIANGVGFGAISIVVSEAFEPDNFSVSILGGGDGVDGTDITNLIVQDGELSNVSQFIPMSQQETTVDVNKANEFLDTNIFELLPTSDTRQARIIRFFQELNALLPPLIEDEQWDADNDEFYDRIAGTDEWVGSSQYRKDYSISYAQDNDDGNIDEEDAFIHRLKSTANDTNSARTIEDIYNTVRPYLRDIWEEPPFLEDERPEYENQSSGYLKFRNPNQGIIIRNTNREFVDGLDPNNLTYLDTGFTITMWVRFLDKVSEGTLFNFGNPLRNDGTSFGFSLETFILKKDGETADDDFPTWGDSVNWMNSQVGNYNTNIFENSNSARFVRLIVKDNDSSDGEGNLFNLRDSCVGFTPYSNSDGTTTFGEKLNTRIPMNPGFNGGDVENVHRLLGATHIPSNFNEWYFICASFNPSILEDESHDDGMTINQGNQDTETNPDYWLNHINPPGLDENMSYSSNSGYGNKCKVEIISRSDLLRARGFKVD